ncbi:MAG: FHA domain-containing protein [Myxococcales bacterium]|nr:FHA domain-containing protein [Myxococcales bacterium]
MSNDPKLQKALDELARFEEGSWRVQPEVAQRVRSALIGRIEALGGTAPADSVAAAARATPPAAQQPEHLPEPEISETPSYVDETPSYVDETPSYVDEPAAHSSETPSYIEELPDYSAEPPAYSAEAPSYVSDTSGHASEYVDVEPFDDAVEDSMIDIGQEEDPNRLVFNFGAPDLQPAEADDDLIVAHEPEELVLDSGADFDLLPDDNGDDDIGSLEIEVAQDRPMLVVHAGTEDEEVLSLDDDGEIRLGRGKACSIRLKDSRASRVHCRVFRSGTNWCVEDLGSANGTLVNGEFLQARTPRDLSGGEELIVGSTVLRFEMGAPEFA